MSPSVNASSSRAGGFMNETGVSMQSSMIKPDGVTGRMQSMGQMSMISANRNNRRDAGPLQDSQQRAASINSSIDFKNITQGSI